MVAVTGWWEEQVVNAKPAPAVLTVIGGTPVVLVGGGPIRPAPAVLTVTGGVPAFGVTQHRKITPAPAVLTLIGSRPALGVTLRPAASELTIAGAAPVVTVSDHKRITPVGGTLEVATAVPVVSLPVVVKPTPAALVITGGYPVLDGSITLRPAGSVLTVTGGVPAFGISDHIRIAPVTAELAVDGGAPSVAVSDHQAVAPDAGELTVAGGVPVVTVSDHKVIEPGAANTIITGGTPDVTVGSAGPSAAVITLGTLLTGTPHGRINVNGVQGATVIAGLCGYYASYNNSRNLRVNGVALPVLSQENAGTTSLTDLKMFQGVVADASGTWLVDTAANHDQSYNANCAAVVSGHTSITPKAAVVIPTGTTSVTVTPPTGGKSLVFIALQWGSSPYTTVSASGVTVVNDLRYTYSSIHMCAVDAATTLNISPAVLTGRSAGLLKQIDIY